MRAIVRHRESSHFAADVFPLETALRVPKVAQVAQIFGRVNTLSGYVGTGSVSAEFSTAASEP